MSGGLRNIVRRLTGRSRGALSGRIRVDDRSLEYPSFFYEEVVGLDPPFECAGRKKRQGIPDLEASRGGSCHYKYRGPGLRVQPGASVNCQSILDSYSALYVSPQEQWAAAANLAPETGVPTDHALVEIPRDVMVGGRGSGRGGRGERQPFLSLKEHQTGDSEWSQEERRGVGAGNGDRTRDFKLGKLALYQLSYARPQSKPT